MRSRNSPPSPHSEAALFIPQAGDRSLKQDRFRLYDLTDTGLGVRDGFGNERFAIPLPRHAELVSASSYLVMLNLFQHLKYETLKQVQGDA